ncbi:penicillin-binding protein 1C [Paracoccus suum]|uniref:peptidoglycan glycosyltransferase n=1 Tax=Paracoccus suum TaxID=2259340 RepID=A0A344PKU1_9RHOB|nr:transglycosylase domain-containing protein [Paracoccus suum]AXC49996.1 penicillin-binding protein 1C [Paracoccus suum]
MARPGSPADDGRLGRRAARGLTALVLALGLGAFAADTARARLDRWIASADLPPLGIITGTEVLARDGSLLRAFQVEDGLWRLAPPAKGIDPRFLPMLLAWEDRRFAQHSGVDPRAIIRAAAQALRHGRVLSGASTLSMQVARLIERGPTGDWRGKIRQARLAMALERRVGKAGIIDLYLRLAPYGGNVEGVRAASLMWFGHEPTRLTPAEIAVLVALPQAPEARRPDRPAGRAALRRARDRVLGQAHAVGLIDAEALADARAAPLPDQRRAFPALAPLLAERLHREMPGAPRIETTIDPDLQRAAETVVARAVRGQTARVSAAAVLADFRTGEILASVGTAEWTGESSAGYVDMTHSLRSPGSTLKPFVYAMAFDDGLIHPETLIEDRPASFGRWQPVNFDRRFRGTVTIRQALTESLNIPVVRVAAALGPARIAGVLNRAGMRLDYAGGVPGLAVVLGGAGVSLQDLAQGYAGLANGGLAVRLHDRPLGQVASADPSGADLPSGPQCGLVTRPSAMPGASAVQSPTAGRHDAAVGCATDAGSLAPKLGMTGQAAANAGAPAARIVGAVAAWYTGAILAQVPPPTGAERGRLAFKTGTSYGHRDALAVGYDGGQVGAVWLGRPDGTPVPGAFGGDLAAPALFDLFDALGSRATPLPPPPPDALTVSNPRLPAPLRRFLAPGEAAPMRPGSSRVGAPEPLAILFPPDGAALEARAGAAITARLRGGAPPYLWLLDGAPVARSDGGETAAIPVSGPGYAALAVIDSTGRSQRVGFSITGGS